MLVIPIARTVAVEHLNDFLQHLDLKIRPNDTEGVIFDLSRCHHICPSGLVTLAAYRDWLNDKEMTAMVRFDRDGLGYALLHALKLFTPKVSELETALQRRHIDRLTEHATQLEKCHSAKEVEDAIRTIIRHIRKEIAPSEEALNTVNWIMGEIVDNAANHGYKLYESGLATYPKPIYLCSVAYRDRVEVAILDRGQGIHDSLRTNPDFKDVSASKSLKLSIKEATSGHPTGSPGFGLYSASQLVSKNMGALYIWSSSRALELRRGNVRVRRGAYRQGTLVSFTLHMDNPTPFSEVVGSSATNEYIEDLIREG